MSVETFDTGQWELGVLCNQLTSKSEFAAAGWSIKQCVHNLFPRTILGQYGGQGGVEAEGRWGIGVMEAVLEGRGCCGGWR